MKNILIASFQDDFDSKLVNWGIKTKGHNAICWFNEMDPLSQSQSIDSVDDFSFSVYVENELLFKSDEIDVVWLRRPEYPKLPENLHPDDVDSARKNWKLFGDSVWWHFRNEVFWINDFKLRELARSKSMQLRTAKRVGFEIPATLISNNSLQIKNFVTRFKGNCVFKPLLVSEWTKNGAKSISRTVDLDINFLQNENAVSVVPGIFQAKINKTYDVRVVYFDGFCVAIKISSKTSLEKNLDWRSIPRNQLQLELIEFPIFVKNTCVYFMNQLGLVFGSFDFVVDEQGKYIFLELNEMGQFLWIEEINEKIPMLSIFCEFLINGKVSKKHLSFDPKLSLENAKQNLIEV